MLHLRHCPRPGCGGAVRVDPTMHPADDHTYCTSCGYRPRPKPLPIVRPDAYVYAPHADIDAAADRGDAYWAKRAALRTKLRALVASGMSVPAAARELGVNERSAYRWAQGLVMYDGKV